VSFLIPTLVVGSYGANARPGYHTWTGFWVMVGFMVILAAVGRGALKIRNIKKVGRASAEK
jgi:Mg2+ and Co2+ transporter CorA